METVGSGVVIAFKFQAHFLWTGTQIGKCTCLCAISSIVIELISNTGFNIADYNYLCVGKSGMKFFCAYTLLDSCRYCCVFAYAIRACIGASIIDAYTCAHHCIVVN